MPVQIYAYVPDGAVAWLWPHDPAAPMPAPQPAVSDVFALNIAKHMVECDAAVRQGWTYDGKTFAAPVATPLRAPPRTATVSALLDALSSSQRATITADHMNRLVARAQLGPVVVIDPKVKRAADDMALTSDAWFDLALTSAR
jgi:hypothetical protein